MSDAGNGQWGINPNTGQPYKRDPKLYDHLRKGGANEPSPPAQRAAGGKPAKRATLKPPPKGTADDYAKKIQTGLEWAGEGLAERIPLPGAVLQARAQKMAPPWGEIAVAKPWLGRFIDRMTTGGVWSSALTETGLTLLLVAHSATNDKGEHTLTGALPSFLQRYLDRALREIMTAYLETPAGQALVARAAAEDIGAGEGGQDGNGDASGPVDGAAAL